MKKLFSLGLMLVALTLMNCSKEEIATEAPAVNGVAFELFAATEDGRTVNSGWNTQWAEGDQITVIHAENGTQDWVQDTPTDKPFTIADVATGRFTGTLQAELDAESYDWYLFYPYSQHMTTPANNPDNTPKGAYMAIGSAYNKTQTQTDNNNLTHIAGSDYPLYGKVTNVAVGEVPSVTMHHVSSLVEFNITNGSEEPITVQKIELTAPEYLIGTFYIDFSGETLSFKDSGPSYVSKTATLTVDGAALATGESAKFYMAVKPFALAAENELTIKVTTDAGICSKAITGKATTFKAGKVKTIGFNYEAQEEEKFADGTYVIVATNANKTAFYAMSGANEGTSGNALNRRAYVDVTSDFDATAASYMTDNDALKWEIAATTGGYTISQDGKYLTCDSGNNYALMGTEPYLLTITPQGDGIYQISSVDASTRILAKNQNSANGFAFYTGSGYNDIYLVPAAADTRTALATPTVTATAEGNTITVSWLEVANAGSYEVTCGEEEPQTITDALTCTFTDLEYEAPYQISVVAKPADTSAYKASEAGTTSVMTEADPNPVVPGTEAVVYEATFNNSGEYRSSGNNSYAVTEKTYLVSNVLWHLVYTDCVTSGSPLDGVANIMARVAKNTTNSPYVYTNNLLTTSKEVTKVTFMASLGSNVTLEVYYSTDGTEWNELSYEKDTIVHSTYGYTATVGNITTADFRLKFQWSVASSTGSNRDNKLDNVTVYGK